VGKDRADDDPKRARRGPKPLGPATVCKPVLVGAALLAAAHTVLPKVL
jgi:hypothetical protein